MRQRLRRIFEQRYLSRTCWRCAAQQGRLQSTKSHSDPELHDILPSVSNLNATLFRRQGSTAGAIGYSLSDKQKRRKGSRQRHALEPSSGARVVAKGKARVARLSEASHTGELRKRSLSFLDNHNGLSLRKNAGSGSLTWNAKQDEATDLKTPSLNGGRWHFSSRRETPKPISLNHNPKRSFSSTSHNQIYHPAVPQADAPDFSSYLSGAGTIKEHLKLWQERQKSRNSAVGAGMTPLNRVDNAKPQATFAEDQDPSEEPERSEDTDPNEELDLALESDSKSDSTYFEAAEAMTSSEKFVRSGDLVAYL